MTRQFKYTTEDMDKMHQKGEILHYNELRCYMGIFTGKLVKPLTDGYKELEKDDKVIIFHLKDYEKYRKAGRYLIERKDGKTWAEHLKE